MEIWNLDGKKREYIKPPWLTTRGWERLSSLLTLCRVEHDMDLILEMASDYVKSSKDENLDKLYVQLTIQLGNYTYKVHQSRLLFEF